MASTDNASTDVGSAGVVVWYMYAAKRDLLPSRQPSPSSSYVFF